MQDIHFIHESLNSLDAILKTIMSLINVICQSNYHELNVFTNIYSFKILPAEKI